MSYRTSAPSLFKAIITGVFSLAILVSCSDSTNPRVSYELDPSRSVEVKVPDSVKQAYATAMALAEEGASGNLRVAATRMAPSLMASASSGARPYVKTRIPFAPEPAPANIIPDLFDDGYFEGIPIGFDFEFYGNVYSQFNLYYNGFITFDPEVPVSEWGTPLGFWTAEVIPAAATPNAMIALAWFDWRPDLVPGSIRYETRGEAPNRRFILQFTNVPDYNRRGTLTSQLVLEEGTNIVTISTKTMTITGFMPRATQGIENGLGTQASYDSVQNTTTPRVRTQFNLSDDAVRFFPPPPNRAPVTLVPGNLSINTAPNSCSAAAQVGYAGVTDDAPGATVVGGVRSDGLPLDALYPLGVTTIAWTTIDVEEKTSTANQTVTVNDAQKPSITAPANLEAVNDPLRGSAVLVAGNAVAADNCGEPSITPSRSDNAELSAPFPVGITTVTWTAKDGSGNTASANQIVTVRDVEAPRITASNIELDATSRSGAVVESYNLVFGDNVRVVQVKCTPEPGSLFRPGLTSVGCTVSDAAGHSASATFVVKVRGAAEQIGAVLGYMETLGLTGGAGNPLMNQLRAALEGIELEGSNSCKKIDDFLRLLADRKKSSEVSIAEMFEIIEDLTRIKAVLGCQ